jgi:hypothetical protein
MGLQIWMVTANILNKQSETDRQRTIVFHPGGWITDLTVVHHTQYVINHLQRLQKWTDALKLM